MKRYILFIFILFNLNSSLFADCNPYDYFHHIPPSLVQSVNAILRFPKSHKLIHEVTRQGKITLLTTSMPGEPEAIWNSNNRSIIINTYTTKNPGRALSSIIFEFHNAKSTDTLYQVHHKASTGQLTKEQYVETIERIEHANALSASELLNKGIQEGFFPKTAKWTVLKNFEAHYRFQQLAGHSQWIARKYDRYPHRDSCTYYHGTIQGLATLSENEKAEMVGYIQAQFKLDTGDSLLKKRTLAELKSRLHTRSTTFKNRAESQKWLDHQREIVRNALGSDTEIECYLFKNEETEAPTSSLLF